MGGRSVVRRREFLKACVGAAVWATLGECLATARVLPQATPARLPRWRGFNLLEKFNVDRNSPFVEQDFAWMAEWGFDFVRLPMDYRCWAKEADAPEFNEQTMKEIDQAVEWGGKYGVHVWINFHRAPGYTVAQPAEPRDLWKDAGIQDICARHWATFARRYKGIGNERLAFNLFNEPANIEPQTYLAVCHKVVGAIRAEDPKRLVVADGIQWGRTPVPELRELGIAQATRGYEPFHLTHYKASWANGERFPYPSWPRPVAFGMLHAPHKTDLTAPLVIDGPFTEAGELRLHVMIVSNQATLVAEADGKKIWEKAFVCGAGHGEWKKAEYKPQWKIYQNLYDRDYVVPIAVGTRQVRLFLTDGDWLQIGEIGFKPSTAAAREDALGLITAYEQKPKPISYTPTDRACPFKTDQMEDRRSLWETMIKPWKTTAAQGIGVMVGEWGAYNKTPHDVTLRWMRDCLTNWKEAGWGWALWNFRGPFGILDSGRADVTYDDFKGHKLDRRMLELLRQF